jgi:hypothetical protein
VPESKFVMPESKFDDIIHDAEKAERDARRAPDHAALCRAVGDLAKVVMALATMLKEQESAQQRAERHLRDADTVPPP